MQKYPQVLLRNFKENRTTSLDEYRRSGGYQGLEKVAGRRSPNEVMQAVVAANLRGRGGAGFPAGKKWQMVPEKSPFPRFIIANSDEMEPGTFKDRVLIHVDPHQLIEGMILAGYSVSAEKGYIFVRPSYESGARILERAVEEAGDAGYLGKNILGSDFSMDIVVHRSAGRYICGEGTALLNAIEGKRPNPILPPPYATEKGLWGLPTVVHNTETLSCVPNIIRNGPDWFKDLAATRSQGGSGTKLFCLSGMLKRPGCYELPIGTRFSEVLEGVGGGMLDGSELKAFMPGGASTKYMTPEFYDVEMDFDPLSKVGHRLGTAAVMIFDHKTCMVGVTLNLIQFFARESCGWCTPCREGLPYIRDILERIERGEGREEYIPMLASMSKHLWKSYCALAPGASFPLDSLLTTFEHEVREHIIQKGCPFGNH